jgi:hypothetical protein
MFGPGSRYENAGTYTVFLPDGTPVTVTRIPLPAGRPLQGWAKRTDSERLDLLAYHYLGDATADAVSLDALASHELIPIPRKT